MRGDEGKQGKRDGKSRRRFGAASATVETEKRKSKRKIYFGIIIYTKCFCSPPSFSFFPFFLMIIMFVSQQSDSFTRLPNVLGLIKTEDSGQESGNVDEIQHHQKPPCLLTLHGAARLTAQGSYWLAGRDWPQALTGYECRKTRPAAPPAALDLLMDLVIRSFPTMAKCRERKITTPNRPDTATAALWT